VCILFVLITLIFIKYHALKMHGGRDGVASHILKIVLGCSWVFVINKWPFYPLKMALIIPFEHETEYTPMPTSCPRKHKLNPVNPELNPICYLLALLGAHHFLHVSRIRVKLLTLRLLMSYIYGAPILDVSRSHTTTQHSR